MYIRFFEKPILMGFFFAFILAPELASQSLTDDALFYYEGSYTKAYSSDFNKFFPGFNKAIKVREGSHFKFTVFAKPLGAKDQLAANENRELKDFDFLSEVSGYFSQARKNYYNIFKPCKTPYGDFRCVKSKSIFTLRFKKKLLLSNNPLILRRFLDKKIVSNSQKSAPKINTDKISMGFSFTRLLGLAFDDPASFELNNQSLNPEKDLFIHLILEPKKNEILMKIDGNLDGSFVKRTDGFPAMKGENSYHWLSVDSSLIAKYALFFSMFKREQVNSFLRCLNEIKNLRPAYFLDFHSEDKLIKALTDKANEKASNLCANYFKFVTLKQKPPQSFQCKGSVGLLNLTEDQTLPKESIQSFPKFLRRIYKDLIIKKGVYCIREGQAELRLKLRYFKKN